MSEGPLSAIRCAGGGREPAGEQTGRQQVYRQSLTARGFEPQLGSEQSTPQRDARDHVGDLTPRRGERAAITRETSRRLPRFLCA